MRELSLHILDALRNSIEAGATEVELTVCEDRGRDLLEVVVRDNGRGMDAKAAARAADAFYSTRTTRRFGLGLALFKATCERCEGGLSIEARPGGGTLVTARMRLRHLDRPPLGDMGAVIQAFACEAERVALRYTHAVDGACFEVSTAQLQEELGEVPLCEPGVLRWLAEHVKEGLKELGSEA